MTHPAMAQVAKRPRDYGIRLGVMSPGPLNDVTDVRVGQVTLKQGEPIRTGVTAIIAQAGNQFQQKSPAAITSGMVLGSWLATVR